MPDAIDDADELYRRLVRTNIDREGRVNSSAYKLNGYPDNNISVNLARLTSIDETIAQAPKPGAGAGSLVARIPRENELSVVHDPLPKNEAHSEIRGTNTKAKCRILAERTSVLRMPDGSPSSDGS